MSNSIWYVHRENSIKNGLAFGSRSAKPHCFGASDLKPEVVGIRILSYLHPQQLQEEQGVGKRSGFGDHLSRICEVPGFSDLVLSTFSSAWLTWLKWRTEEACLWAIKTLLEVREHFTSWKFFNFGAFKRCGGEVFFRGDELAVSQDKDRLR